MTDLLERQDITTRYNVYCIAATAAAIRGQRLHPNISRSQYPPRWSRLSSLLDMISINLELSAYHHCYPHPLSFRSHFAVYMVMCTPWMRDY
jgi:hypothetical protein